MLLNQIFINILLFFIGVFGIISNKRNILIVLMCTEFVFLSVNINFIIISMYLDDFYGQIFALFILTVAAAESAIGLAILISYYRIRGNIDIHQKNLLK